MGVVIWIGAGLAWLGANALLLVLNHGAHVGSMPRPEVPSIGADLDDDPDAEREHSAWLNEGEPSA